VCLRRRHRNGLRNSGIESRTPYALPGRVRGFCRAKCECCRLTCHAANRSGTAAARAPGPIVSPSTTPVGDEMPVRPMSPPTMCGCKMTQMQIYNSNQLYTSETVQLTIRYCCNYTSFMWRCTVNYCR